MKSTVCKLTLLFAALCLITTLVACRENGSGPDGIDPAVTGDTTAAVTVPATEPDESSTEPVIEETTAPEVTVEETTVDYFEANRIETVSPDLTKVPDVAVTDKGYDIYQLTRGREWGYRYGCTYLYNDDGSVDAYFACVGTISGEWDWIAYRHSPDGGNTWEAEKIVLTPTQNSLDHFSNCDPGVIYFNGYYYLGYTSTLHSTGFNNNIFVARSKNPDGPFEKWNGEGWGGYEPEPIVYFDQDYNSWGIGEPSFVELNGTLYIYYTASCPSGEYTMVATADATDENWPATMQFHGVACKKNTDSLDVKYVEEWGKFVAVATGSRMGPNSWLGIYESNDGMTFELVDIVREGTYSHLHNAGISSRPNGHIKITEDADKLRVIYAYGEGWGTWNTRVQPISLELSSGNDMTAEQIKPCLSDEHLRAELIPVEDRHITMVRPSQDVYQYALSKGSFVINLNRFDTYFEQSLLPRTVEEVEFVVYDESVVTIKNRKATIHGVGTTPVEVRYAGCTYLFHVVITEENENSGSATEAVDFIPVKDTYTIYIGERSIYKPQLRARMWWANGTFTEYYCDTTDEVVTFTGYDESIISVNEKGIVTARKVGETTVTLSYKGKSCQIKVVISADEADSYFHMGEIAEVDYVNMDFTIPSTVDGVGGINNAKPEYDAEEGAMKVTVTGDDSFFTVPYSQSSEPLMAENYTKIEITYMVPKGNSPSSTDYQMFFCVGEITQANAAYQVRQRLTRDGEYHTLTVDLSKLSYWTGVIHSIRMDYFDASETGDIIYIKSITLS